MKQIWTIFKSQAEATEPEDDSSVLAKFENAETAGIHWKHNITNSLETENRKTKFLNFWNLPISNRTEIVRQVLPIPA